jgi:hypothetical protein
MRARSARTSELVVKQKNVKNMKIKSCPFCGITPIYFGQEQSRKTGEMHIEVKHEFTKKCPLDMFIFKLKEWNKRV